MLWRAAFISVCMLTLLSGCRSVAGSPSFPERGAESARNGTSTFVSATGAGSIVVEKVLYFFSGADGAQPVANLIDVKGTLYGTTAGGGSYCAGSGGCGTAFSLSTNGTEKVLHSFGNRTDGSSPFAGLIQINGTLYGTTNNGGAHCASTGGCGTVFSITTSGFVTLLHSFGSGTDGVNPNASLINVNGTLYGTTAGGGSYCAGGRCGTVFSVSTDGRTEKVLHSFGSGTDGATPFASLIDVNGTLYGTTAQGGTHCTGSGGCGTVFSISTTGTEKVLHSFSGSDGDYPSASLVDVNGTLYGTTSYGGAPCGISGGCGTVFSISKDGRTEKVLHSFGSGTDGVTPFASLIDVNGTLYGTTFYGGAHCTVSGGCGTVFSISTSGTEKVLHSFGSGADGVNPQARLNDANGTLYGTTVVGGKHNNGTVFTLTLSSIDRRHRWRR